MKKKIIIFRVIGWCMMIVGIVCLGYDNVMNVLPHNYFTLGLILALTVGGAFMNNYAVAKFKFTFSNAFSMVMVTVVTVLFYLNIIP